MRVPAVTVKTAGGTPSSVAFEFLAKGINSRRVYGPWRTSELIVFVWTVEHPIAVLLYREALLGARPTGKIFTICTVVLYKLGPNQSAR